MDLLDQLRDMRDREAAILPRPGLSEAGEIVPGNMEPQRALMQRAMELLVSSSDHELCASYKRTSGKPGDPEADALLAEIERRGLTPLATFIRY